ncbi:MAG: hypothetical protein C4527_07165 [Candidatus Omnitrophota bacterium]|nr:MAG: hypothetical protein C4527_07165 [Candidatus Omnitrophota bacterium]
MPRRKKNDGNPFNGGYNCWIQTSPPVRGTYSPESASVFPKAFIELATNSSMREMRCSADCFRYHSIAFFLMQSLYYFSYLIHMDPFHSFLLIS